ncbi:MAG: hypothetical protein GY906_37165 [bacterium]|nr:hypothetical protein [bacterium]
MAWTTEAIPTGIKTGKDDEGNVTYFKYEVNVDVAETLEDWFEYWKSLDLNPEATALAIINQEQRQAQKQGEKGNVRDAYRKAKGDENAKGVIEAVKAHREDVKGRRLGMPTKVGGVTKTKAGEVGKALLAADPDKLKELAAQMGIEL